MTQTKLIHKNMLSQLPQKYKFIQKYSVTVKGLTTNLKSVKTHLQPQT